jgi:hypothetical protein
MRKNVIISNITCILMLALISFKAKAQDNSDSKEFKPHGKLWGLAFGDFAYKADADTVGGGRGSANQYTKVPKDMNMFQFRRVYLGYNYEISEKFSAELVLAAENFTAGGDLSAAGKFSPFIKLANLRWKNIWKGTDIIIGQLGTPSYAQTSEVYWGYRSIEKTIIDIKGTSSYDFGIGLQGKILPKNDNYGYNLLVANGAGSKPETDRFKWFYGDVYAKFLNKKLMVDLYADYNRMNWADSFHRARSMVKLFVGYMTPKVTVGAEVFMNDLMGDNIATRKIGGTKDTLTTKSLGYSVFVRGRIYKDKLGFFARYDNFDASRNIDNSVYSSYKPLTAPYDPNTQEQFITAGIDYTPMKNVHIMPNIWYNAYKNAGPASSKVAPDMNDVVYRLTFYYVYGK